MSAPVIVYRGRYQRRRLDLVLSAFERCGFASAEVIWLAPQNERSECAGFLADLEDRHRARMPIAGAVWDGRWVAAPSVRRRLFGEIGERPSILMGAGAPAFVPRAMRTRSWWVMQGIPEERSIGATGMSLAAVKTRAEWMALRAFPPARVIVPSAQMRAHLCRRLRVPSSRVAVIPNTVPVAEFRVARESPRTSPRWVYVGSASRWQQIGAILAVWRCASSREPDLAFRIVSTDQRMRAMVREVFGAHDDRVEMISAVGTGEVVAALGDCTLGFLLREPHVVNEVAWPVKFGEYLAAGVPVALSDIDWSLSELVRGTDAAILVEPTMGPSAAADLCLQRADALRVSDELLSAVDHDRCAERLSDIVADSLNA